MSSFVDTGYEYQALVTIDEHMVWSIGNDEFVGLELYVGNIVKMPGGGIREGNVPRVIGHTVWTRLENETVAHLVLEGTNLDSKICRSSFCSLGPTPHPRLSLCNPIDDETGELRERRGR